MLYVVLLMKNLHYESVCLLNTDQSDFTLFILTIKVLYQLMFH